MRLLSNALYSNYFKGVKVDTKNSCGYKNALMTVRNNFWQKKLKRIWKQSKKKYRGGYIGTVTQNFAHYSLGKDVILAKQITPSTQERKINIVFVGEHNVGKTCVLVHYTKSSFAVYIPHYHELHTELRKLYYSFLLIKSIEVQNVKQKIFLSLVDTTCYTHQERFRRILGKKFQ